MVPYPARVTGCECGKPAVRCGGFEEPLFVQSLIPLSPGGGPLFRQVYLGLRKAILAGAFARGVGVYGIAPYYLKRPARTDLLLGYSRLTESDIQEGIRRLAKVL